MTEKYIILDCNYLCHRLKHSMGSLSYGGTATGIVYGFLKSLPPLQGLFDSDRFVFCWDSKKSKRKEIYPEYKANRKKVDRTEEEWAFENDFCHQMRNLRRAYLPLIGFRNILHQTGYESDDMMAAASTAVNVAEMAMLKAVIVTSDKDLYQCITPDTDCYNPQTNKILTFQGFRKQYGIPPHEWAMVKATAGCPTDNVKGVKGVGEKTALKYMTGTLGKSTKAYRTIISKEGRELYYRNMHLVKLPMRGTKEIRLVEDELSETGWKQVTEMLGMKSIRDKMPFGRQK